jgi:hypothetical protein
MKLRNIIYVIVILMLNVLKKSGCEEYDALKAKGNKSIELKDLPCEFSEEALITINDFIKKTDGLNREFVIHFDYITGEIINCASGMLNHVESDINEEDIKGKHVASIHNHPIEVLSPPSGKNFKILKRDYEDYELIAGFEYFWILKAKGLHEDLIEEMNDASDTAFLSSFLHCTVRYNDDEIFNRMQDLRYGGELSKYINDKNISDIQLTKREYVIMDTDSRTAAYGGRKRITDPEVIKFAREFEKNPFTPTGRDIMYNFYKRVGMDVEYDEIFTD